MKEIWVLTQGTGYVFGISFDKAKAIAYGTYLTGVPVTCCIATAPFTAAKTVVPNEYAWVNDHNADLNVYLTPVTECFIDRFAAFKLRCR